MKLTTQRMIPQLGRPQPKIRPLRTTRPVPETIIYCSSKLLVARSLDPPIGAMLNQADYDAMGNVINLLCPQIQERRHALLLSLCERLSLLRHLCRRA